MLTKDREDEPHGARGTQGGRGVDKSASLRGRTEQILTQRRRDTETQKGKRLGVFTLLQPVDHAMDALPHQSLAEIDDEREPEIAEPQVGESLRFEQAISFIQSLPFCASGAPGQVWERRM